MNILFLADPHSIHDHKWIDFFLAKKSNQAYILPRAGQMEAPLPPTYTSNSILLEPIIDFSIVRFYITILTAIRIRSIIKKNKIDLIHILYAEPNAMWCLFKKYFRVPMIISTRGTDVLQAIPKTFHNRKGINYLVAPLYKKSFLVADWITATSAKQMNSILLFSGRNKKKSIVRTGVDLKILSTKLNNLQSLNYEGNYLFFPRFISPVYNHEFCLDAIQKLPLQLKKNFKMIFVGYNSGNLKYQNFLEERMKSISDVHFIFLEKQTQEQLIDLYKKASLVIMTPLSDGSPVTAMEALLCGTRVIMGPLEYDEEIFENTSVILKKWDTEELAETIVDLLSTPEKNKVVLSQEKIRLMDRDYNMNQLNEVYIKVLNENRQ